MENVINPYYDAFGGTPGVTDISNWTQLGGSFTTLSNAAYIKVQLRTQQTSGWLTFDDVSLQGGAERVYYYAGSARVAMRQAGLLSYLLGDHLGSTSVTADKNGAKGPGQLYKAWGEIRLSGSSTLPTTYRFTGQRQEHYIHIGSPDSALTLLFQLPMPPVFDGGQG